MAKYGTILLLYNTSESELESVSTLLQSYDIPFLKKENSLFFKTLSKRNRDQIASKLNERDLTFILFHNNNSDGDRIKNGNISNDTRRLINEYLIEE